MKIFIDGNILFMACVLVNTTRILFYAPQKYAYEIVTKETDLPLQEKPVVARAIGARVHIY